MMVAHARLLLVLLIVCHSASAPAFAFDDKFEMWQPVFMDFPVGHPKIRGYLESNSRLRPSRPESNINQYLLRTALGYKLRENIEFFQGYAWVQTWNPRYIAEQRTYQQLGIGHVLFKRLQVLHRLRTEQRFIEHKHGVANRGRYLLRFARPIGNTEFYLVGSDELFVNFNSLEGGPIRGIDQNRLYGGVGRQISRYLRAEIGYQWQYVNVADPIDDISSNALMTQFFVHF